MGQPDPTADIAPADWAFHVDTGRACLNFIATVGDRGRLAFDRWRRSGDLARWCVEAGLLAESPSIHLRQLETARALREAIYRTVMAVRGGKRPRRADVEVINRWAAQPLPAPQLGDNGREIIVRFGKPLEAVLAMVARDAIELVSSPAIDKVRQCGETSCSVLFVDTSRPGKRRWCSMSRCGNRMKKVAYRQRLRREQTAEP